MVTVREVNTPSGFDSLREPWAQLLHANAIDTVFLTHEWMRTWWKHFGEGGRLLVLVLEEGDHLVGIAPLWIGRTEKAFGLFRKVSFLGTGLSDYLGLILPQPTPERIDALASALLERSRLWDYIDLREVPEPELITMLASALRRAGLPAHVTADSECVSLPIETDWQTFTREKMHKRSRRRMRTREKLLREAGETRLEFHEDLDRNPEPLERIAPMPQAETYQGEVRRPVFADPRKKAFLEEISRVFSSRHWLLLSELDVNDRLAAYGYGFVYEDRYLFYSMGFDPDLVKLSPGRALVDRLVEECFRRGLGEVDFMRGAESWKSSFSSDIRTNARMLAFRNTPRGLLARRLSPKPGEVPTMASAA